MGTGASRSAYACAAHRRAAGFSLIELMIVVCIVAILAAIAVPAYRKYVLQANRTDAVRALTSNAQILQRCYSQTFTFTSCAGSLAVTSPNGYYMIVNAETDASAGPPVTPATFTITAAAVGPQTADTTCAVFTLTQTGQETAESSTGVDESSTCWGGN